MLLTILSFVFVLGILIFIHELGHFLVAKRVGIRVEKFSLGFPPNIFSRTFGDTTYCIGVIPLGGYVKMAGEHPEDGQTGAPDEFMSKSVWQRAAVIFAGPFMNYVLAIFLLIGIVYSTGQPRYDEGRILVGQVSEDSPAAGAGLLEGDQIIGLNGEQVSQFDSLRTRLNGFVSEEIELIWIHEGDTVSQKMTTMTVPTLTEDGEIDSVGIIGFRQHAVGYDRFGLVESAQRGFIGAHVIVYETVRFVKQLVTGQISGKMVGGPLFIAQQSGKEARKGAFFLFRFMALLSVNLAVINVLPIPVLDGGQLVFLAVEKIKGGPLSLKARAISQQIGILVVLTVVLAVTYNDIVRVFKGL
ncbi:MAG: RIP metalloprotease RseP [Candidatus Zixiibacteriota bacterium]